MGAKRCLTWLFGLAPLGKVFYPAHTVRLDKRLPWKLGLSELASSSGSDTSYVLLYILFVPPLPLATATKTSSVNLCLSFLQVHPDNNLLRLISELCFCHGASPALQGVLGTHPGTQGDWGVNTQEPTPGQWDWEPMDECFLLCPTVDGSEAYFVWLFLKSHWIKLQPPTMGN